MDKRIRIIISILILLTSLLACNLPSLIPDQVSIPQDRTGPAKPTTTFTPSPTPTITPEPTLTSTFTPTPTQVVETTATPTYTPLPLNMQLQVFEDLWSVINETYVYPDFNGVDWDAVRTEFRQRIEAGLDHDGFYIAMNEMIARLGDDHSYYLSPEAMAQSEADFAGQHDYVGIGVLLSAVQESNRAVILSVFSGSPAEAAGLQARDSLLTVDDQPILDTDGYLRSDLVRGPEGTSITLQIQTPGESAREILVTRHRITGSVPVTYSVVNSPGGLRIGYIFLVGFDDSTIDDQVEDALRDMTADTPLDGLILDNRMNAGGSSAVVEPILGFFSDGVMGYYVNRQEDRPLNIRANDINGSQEVPMVVLVGSGSASYGEVFPGVLQDSGRAHIIGIPTDGNVEILWGYDFADGSQVWIASETFRPRFHPEQDWEATGIIPDENVPGEFYQYTLENDPPVIAAMTYFENLP